MTRCFTSPDCETAPRSGELKSRCVRPTAPAGVAVLALLLLVGGVPVAELSAQGQPQAAQAPTDPALPPRRDDVSATELMESARSEIRIIGRENHQIQEYRSGNNVYKIKVMPKNAPPYYLVDQDGSGDLQWKRGPDLERNSVPHWALFRW